MPSTNPFASEVATKFVKANPDVPTHQLARLMRKKHPHVFPSFEAARSAIRYRRGANGVLNRSSVGVAKIQVTPASRSNPLNPLSLPESGAIDRPDFQMDGVTRCLILPDIHIPYHDLTALTVMLQDGIRVGVDGVLLNGDLCDFHTISHYCKDPGARSFTEERKTVRAFLARLRELFPKARIVFKEGNHDERLRTYVMEHAKEIYDEEILGLRQLLGLDDLGIDHVHEKRTVMLGKLPILHGHELPRGISTPVNPARGAFLRAKTSAMVSHHHKTSENTEKALGGDIVTTWSTGCACNLRPLFEPNNGWNHGHAIVEITKGGMFHVRNVRIHDGEMLN